MSKNIFLIIDGSSLFFRAFYALPLLKTKRGIYTNAIYGFVMMLENAIERVKPSHIVVCFDRKGKTFRSELYKDYKGTRQKTPNELEQQFPLVRDILKYMNIVVLDSPVYEADDIAGTLSLIASKEGYKSYLLTGDKDYYQLVDDNTNVLMTRKGITELEVVNLKSINDDYGISPQEFIDLKGLMGDSSDNIPGVPGIGPKTGLKLIKEYSTIENLYNHLSEISGKKLKENLEENKVQAFMSKKLGTIVRNIDLPVGLSDLKIKEYDYENLSKLYRDFEFNSILKRLPEKYQKEKTEEISDTFFQISNDSIDDIIENIKASKSFAFKFISDGKIYEGIDPFKIAILPKGYNTSVIDYNKDNLSNLKALWEDDSIEKLGYDLKEDIIVLQYNKIDLKNYCHDSMIAEYLLNSTESNYEIDHLASSYFNKAYKSEEELLGKGVKKKKFQEIDEGDLNSYFSYILNMVYTISPLQMQKIEAEGMKDLYVNVELPLIEVLANMEIVGIRTDVNILNEIDEKIKERINDLEFNIYKDADEQFNINSPKQLGKILFEKMDLPVIKKTKTGYSTSADVLEKLRGKSLIIDNILEYRKISKIKNTYIDGLRDVINKKTGRIHSRFNQTVTSTGRISSTEPNLQNIPIKTHEGRLIRKALLSSEGSSLVDSDYSQIELRVLASLSNDTYMINAFADGLDIHRKTASEVFHTPYDEVSDELRSMAKAVNFGIVYGISDYGLSQNLNIPRKEAKTYIDNYLGHFQGIKKYMNDIIHVGTEKGYVETLLHRRRYIPELKAKNFNIRSFGERIALNTPIQGTAADIIKIAMVGVYKELKKKNLKAKLILQIHDELVVDAPDEEVAEVCEIMKDVMDNALIMKVPLSVSMKTGKSLYETK